MGNTKRTKTSKTLEKTMMVQTNKEKIEMTLNADNSFASGLLIQRLTELYADPISAAVRETVSNAMDSVLESNSQARPTVWIESPTNLNPILTIKDNGVGMTYDDIKNIYSKYGSSTKRDNFNQLGAYGLGAKAPLAYGTQFTISSVKDGEKTIAIVSREELTNYIEIIHKGETEEESGTSISIPVKNGDTDKFLYVLNKYKNTPLEMNLDLYIDDVLKDNGNLIELENEIELFNGDNGEVVTGKVWFKDLNGIISTLTSGDSRNLKSRIALVIGGWDYSNDGLENNAYINFSFTSHLSDNYNQKIYVELKPGLVSFNSSRDSILDDERYQDLMSKITKELTSEEVSKGLIKTGEEADLEEFKDVCFETLPNHDSLVVRDVNGSLILNSGSKSIYQPQVKNKFNTINLVHKETGFSFANLLNSKEPSSSFSKRVIIEKVFGDKSSMTYRTRLKPITNGASFMEVDKISISLLKKNMVFAANSEEKGINDRFGFNLITSLISSSNYISRRYSKSRPKLPNKQRESIVLIVPEATEEIATKILNIKNEIIKEILPLDIDASHRLELIFTTNNKSYVEEKSKLFEEVTILSYLEIMEKLKDIRKKNKEKPKQKEKAIAPLSTFLEFYDMTDKKNKDIDESFTPKTKKTIVLMVGENERVNFIDSSHIVNWYCNENNIEPKDLTLLISTGEHKVTDFKILEGKGDLFVLDFGKRVSTSNYYTKNHSESIAGFNYILNTEEDKEEKAISYFIRSLFNIKSDKTLSDLLSVPLSGKFEDLISSNVALEEPYKFKKEHFEGILQEASSIVERFPTMLNVNWQTVELKDSVEKHLLSFLSKEKARFLELAFNLISRSMFSNVKISILNSKVLYSRESPDYLSKLEILAMKDESENLSLIKKLAIEKAKIISSELSEVFYSVSQK